MQFLRQKKKSIVANGERIWEGDPRYEELTRPKKNPSEDEKEKAEIDEVLEEQWKEDRAKILSFFTPMLFAKVAAWVAVFYYLSPVARPALVFLTLFVLIFWNLGKRKKGEMSAYNIFNPNYGRIGGDNLVQQFQAQFLNRPQQNDAQPARQRQTASGGTEQDSDSDEDIDIDSLKPRDKVVVVTRQGLLQVGRRSRFNCVAAVVYRVSLCGVQVGD